MDVWKPDLIVQKLNSKSGTTGGNGTDSTNTAGGRAMVDGVCWELGMVRGVSTVCLIASEEDEGHRAT